MLTRQAPSRRDSSGAHSNNTYRRQIGAHIWEAAVAGEIFALAVALRLALAMRGWPYLNSDEAVMGLMSVDIWHGNARPIFTYSQDYMGALQAYLAAPFFALLHGDPLALRLATLVQTALFLVVMYALARRLYTRGVALFTLALLALGPQYALKHQLQAGVGAQDTLLFGALVVWLATLRLRGGWSRGAALALDAGFGLAVGLGLWGDFLFLPYVAVAVVALAYTTVRRLIDAASAGSWWGSARRLAGDAGATALAFIIGLGPFLAANIASHGRTLRSVTKIAGTPGASAASESVAAHVTQWAGQIGATLLAGLPNALGSDLLCQGCVVWPAQGSVVSASAALRAVAIALPFTLVALGLWLWSALPLAHDIRRAVSGIVSARALGWRAALERMPRLNARWWGRFMLAGGGALTLLQYMVSRASFTYPTFTNRYLIGLYICAPLVAAPLVVAARSVWQAISQRRTPSPVSAFGVGLLVVILGLSVAGSTHVVAISSDASQFGDPTNTRDARLITFLESHNATRFYTGYWTCNRLILATEERLSCAVIGPHDAFTSGFNRYPPATHAVRAAAHPAWVFNMQALDVDVNVPQQVAACVRDHRPRCAGYTSATVNGYLIFYYAAAPLSR